MATLRQLEYLVTVADTGSFTHAADLLYVTQPALSHQIRALENDLGGPVFERLPRRIRLTPLGRAVLPHARATLADAERLHGAARRASGLEEGELEVAAIYSVSLGILPPVLHSWRRQHPGVLIRLREYSHADALQAAMLTGQADLAIGPTPEQWEGPIRPLGVEEFVVVLAADDPAAASVSERPPSAVRALDDSADARADAPIDRIALAGLADRAWVHFAPGNGLADVLNRACAEAGFQPRVAIRAEQTSAAMLLAAAGLGPTLVPATIVPPGFEGVALLPDPPVRRPLAAYTRSRPDPLTTAFVDLLAERARVLPPHVAGRGAAPLR